MNLSFSNGNDTQRGRWKESLERLLHLPSSSFDLTIEVSFVDPSELSNSHTTLADTTWSYGSSSSTTEVRNTAPGFGDVRASLEAEAKGVGLTFSAEKFYTETAVHELGHSLFAAFPEESRVAIAQMFGAKSDDLAELAPSGVAWQNKIIEGIAETFKEAFLPRRFRVFPNRTNKGIAYSEYPAFRALWRKGVESIPAEGGFNHDVLELDFKDMRVAWPASSVFEHQGANVYYTAYSAGYDLFSSKIPSDHTFSLGFTPPTFPVVDVPKGLILGAIIFGWRYRIEVNGVVQHKFRGVWAGGRPSNAELVEFYVNWYLPASNEWDVGEGIASPFATWFAGAKSLFVPNEIEKEGEGWTANYQTYEDAIALGPLPVALSDSLSVSKGDTVSIHARALGLEWATPGGPNFEEEAKERMGRLLPLGEVLPLMHYAEPGTEGGQVIELPSGLLVPAGSINGSLPSLHAVSGP